MAGETITVVETPEGDSEAVETAELTSVAAAGSAAGVAAANADSAAQSAEAAALLATNVENAAERAEVAAAVAAGSAESAAEAEYATREQMSAVEGTLAEIRDLLAARAVEPAPEPPKQRTVKRDSAPAKPTHFLRRKIGGGK